MVFPFPFSKASFFRYPVFLTRHFFCKNTRQLSVTDRVKSFPVLLRLEESTKIFQGLPKGSCLIPRGCFKGTLQNLPDAAVFLLEFLLEELLSFDFGILGAAFYLCHTEQKKQNLGVTSKLSVFFFVLEDGFGRPECWFTKVYLFCSTPNFRQVIEKVGFLKAGWHSFGRKLVLMFLFSLCTSIL